MSKDKLQLHTNSIRDFIVGNQQELASASLLNISGNNPSEEEFSKLVQPLTGFLSDKAIITVLSHDSNKDVIAELYRIYGVPFHTFIVPQRNNTQSILLFSKNPPTMSRKKVVPWGMGALKGFISLQHAKKSKTTASRELNTMISTLTQMNSDVDWAAVKLNSSGNPVLPASLTRIKVATPHVLKVSDKELKGEHRIIENMAKPDGLTDDDKELNVPSAVFEYIIENFIPNHGKIVDINAMTGDFAQSVHKLVNDGRKNSLLVHTHNKETLAYERLEALSNGAWQNWTYHEPAKYVFTIIEEVEEVKPQDENEQEETG